jgi:hypothetical protein
MKRVSDESVMKPEKRLALTFTISGVLLPELFV